MWTITKILKRLFSTKPCEGELRYFNDVLTNSDDWVIYWLNCPGIKISREEAIKLVTAEKKRINKILAVWS